MSGAGQVGCDLSGHPQNYAHDCAEWDNDLLDCLLGNVAVQVWFCPVREHQRVTWDGDVATCDECGRSSRGVGASRACSGPTSQPPTSVSGHDLSRSIGADPSTGVGPA